MSCDDFVYSPRGRQGIGVIQPQSGLDYPFVAPSEDVRFLFADFFISYDDPYDYGLADEPYALPFRLQWVGGIGCAGYAAEDFSSAAHDADLIVVDAENRVVFDSTEAQTFDSRTWGANYRIYEWAASKTTNTPISAVCRAVVYTTWPTAFEIPPKNFPQYFTPDNAVLDGRTTYRMPKRVLSITVKAGNEVVGAIDTAPSASFFEGYNMRIRAGAPTFNAQIRDTELSFAAIPGEGAGRYSDCAETPPPAISSINGVQPDENGDFLLAAANCGYVRVPTTTDGTTTSPIKANGFPILSVGDNCPPCCDCADYVNIALYMNRLHERYKLIGERTQQIKQLYANNRLRWKTQYSLRTLNPLKLLLVPQYCPYLDVVMLFCNHCDDCAKNVRLAASFSAVPGGSAEVVCGHTELHAPCVRAGSPIKIDGSWPNFYADLPPINKGESGYVKFRLRFSPRYPLTISGILTGTKAAVPIVESCDSATPAFAEAQEVLNCDKLGNNSQPC